MKKSIKILIVDDEPYILNYLKIVLEKADFQVYSAGNGVDGLILAEDKIPDIIISDYIMPKMNGIDFCKAAKNNSKLNNTFFLILTARAEKQEQIKILNSGADDFITKPISVEELVAKVNAFARIQKMKSEVIEKQRDIHLLKKELIETTKNLKIINNALKINRSGTSSQNLISAGQISNRTEDNLHNPMHFLRNNVSVLRNYFEDLRELITKFDFILDSVNTNSNGQTREIIHEYEKYKEKIDIESIFADSNQLFKETIYSIEKIDKNVTGSELVSNVELN